MAGKRRSNIQLAEEYIRKAKIYVSKVIDSPEYEHYPYIREAYDNLYEAMRCTRRE